MTFERDEQFLETLNELRLLPEEQARAKNFLKTYFAENPPQNPVRAFLVRHSISAAFATILLFVGGITVFAHLSLPGDLLYPVKLAVNDRVALAVVGDDDARLDAELAQIDRIIYEEEKVAMKLFDEEELGSEVSWTEDYEQDQLNASANVSIVTDEWGFDEIDAELRALEQELKDIEQSEFPEN